MASQRINPKDTTNLVVLNLAHVQARLREPRKPLLEGDEQALGALGEHVPLLRVHDHVLHDASPGRRLGAPTAPHVDGGLHAVGDLQRVVLRREVQAVEEAVRGEVLRGDVAVYDVAQRRAPVLTHSKNESCQNIEMHKHSIDRYVTMFALRCTFGSESR
jgi:hypothetical protein